MLFGLFWQRRAGALKNIAGVLFVAFVNFHVVTIPLVAQWDECFYSAIGVWPGQDWEGWRIILAVTL